MSFLSRFFGSSHPLDEIRKASNQGRWADVLSFSSALEDKLLSASEQTQLRELVDSAAEHLAKINYEEGLASLRAGDFRRGMEHLDLARQLVHSSALRELINAEFAPTLVRKKLNLEIIPPWHSRKLRLTHKHFH